MLAKMALLSLLQLFAILFLSLDKKRQTSKMMFVFIVNRPIERFLIKV